MLSEAIKVQEDKLYNYRSSTLREAKAHSKSPVKRNVANLASNTHKSNNQSSLDMVKKIWDEYGMTRKQVFEIHSQFKAMTVPMEDSKSGGGPHEGTTIDDDYREAVKTMKRKELRSHNPNLSMNDSAGNINSSDVHANVEKPDGIPIDYFAKNCTFLHGVHPEIKTRLLKALGIDTERRNSIIKWEDFVELYCICELGELNKEELIRFWIRFLDPSMLGIVAEEALLDILEKLVRGTSLSEPNEWTYLFAKSMIKSY